MSIIHDRIADALEAAEEDGLTGAEIGEIAGRWWRNRLAEMRSAGYVVAVERDRYFLVARRGARRRAGGRDGTPDRLAAGDPASASSSTAERLFDLPPLSPYSKEAA